MVARRKAPPAPPTARPSRIVTSLILGGLLLGACVVAAASGVAWAVRERTLVEAGREARNTAFILADHTERAVQAVDLALEATLERGAAAGALASPGTYAAWAGSRAVFDAMRDRVAVLPPLDGIILLDGAGKLVGSTRAWPLNRVDNADRDYFQVARDAGPTPYVALPIESRATGEWMVPVSRPVTGPDGGFLGVAMGAIASDHLAGLFGALALGPGVSISLLRDDGVILARSPAIEGLIGRNVRGQPGTERARKPPAGEPVRMVGLDRMDRIMVGQAVARFPLRIVVGLSIEAVLAPWRSAIRRLAAGTLLLLLVLAAAVAAAVRAVRLEAAAADERTRLQEALSIQQRDFRLAVEGMSQAVWRFGADGRMMLTNGRCAEVLGLPAACIGAGGLTLDALLDAAEAAAAAGAAEVIRALGARVAAGQPASFLSDLADGRTVAVLWRPMGDGGWLATFEDVTERHAAEARARFLARHDSLTGLPNRLGLQEHLAALLPELETGGGRAAMLCLDLDRFKEINDTLGHAVGDKLLRAVVERIRARVRQRRGGGDFVARLGGDEFAVVTAPGFEVAGDAAADAAGIAARLVRSIAEPFDIDGHRVVIGGSIGIALYPADGATAEALLRNADLALYRAKHEGRGRHCFFTPAMAETARARRGLEAELRRALEAPDPSEFVVHYQPLVDVGTREVTGFEALLRWRHAERGLIPPADFVPIAEEIGLIGVLGELVLARACREAVGWPDPVRIAVNVSALQFRRVGLVEGVLRRLAETGLAPHRLELEITEGALLRSTEATVALLHRLRAVGVRIALDDFGTGYSSLSYLLAFPFDKIKVDRSFIGQATGDANARAIIRAVAGLSAQLGVTMTAEGVETEAQLRLLAAEGCGEAQGFLFGRPVDAREVPGVLAALGHAGQRPMAGRDGRAPAEECPPGPITEGFLR